MKSVIFYRSSYQGNTLKIAREIAQSLQAKLVRIEDADKADLSAYDLIGLGSAIHYAAHDIRLQRLAEGLDLTGRDVFIFSTRCRPNLGGYHKHLRRIIAAKGGRIIGEFSARGFDRTGPWTGMDGYNKGRPDRRDIFKARLFAEGLRRKMLRRKFDGRIERGQIVCLDTGSCTACGACVRRCPMNILYLDGKIHVTDDRDCIQCQQCAYACLSDSIYVNESLINGIRIALRETFSTRLQRAYRNGK
ncbi:MAG: 4Fe-4S binding protein [Pseudoflavonifractor sp.]|nr:4Fe-4S binding protein [Pseudoflavonifractor sp.]